MLFLLLVTIAAFVFAEVINNTRINQKEEIIASLKKELNTSKSLIMTLETQNSNLKRELYQNLAILDDIENYSVLDKEVLFDCVKVLMKKHHPDNGGDAAEFMKYKKIYDNLKKK